MKYPGIAEEKELYKALTSLEGVGFLNKIKTGEGNKVTLSYVLQRYKGYDFSEFFEILEKQRKSTKTLHEYVEFVSNHPIIELLGKFIDCGFLNKDLTYKNTYFVGIGKELLNKNELSKFRIREGLILRDGRLFPIKSNEVHRLGSLWLYINGYRVEDMVRYTTDYFSKEPIFSSTSDYVLRSSNELAISREQAIAMRNIYNAKCGDHYDFCKAIRSHTDLSLLPFSDSQIRYHNANIFEDVLGKSVFNARKVLEEIREESYLFHK